MRILTCASYYGTGSSAITDLLAEYNCCKSLTDYEFRFLQDPEGISDLEYNLVENHHRHNSGHALKRYKQKVDFLSGNKISKKYEPFFNYKWKKYSYEYIENLTDLKYKGYWHQDVIDRGKTFYSIKRLENKILQKTIWRNKREVSLNEIPKEITLCSHPTEEKFLSCTKQYIDKLFKEANVEGKENIIVDQIVPPSNIRRYARYFNDIKIFIVDRDPRDIYLSEKYVWKGSVIPTESVEVFCNWFKYTRKHRNIEEYNENNTMFIKFEDLVYKYDETKMNIENWLEISNKNHTKKETSFIPSKSILNTKLWEKIDCDKSDIAYIEENLKQYIYDYSSI